jgi:hypothetical protein
MAGRLTNSGGKNSPRTKPIVEKKLCVGNCKKEQPLTSGFYSANVDIFPDGRLHLCRVCVEEYILKKGFNGLLTILRVMDKPFLQELYKEDYKDYIRQINSLPQYRGLTYENSIFENKSNLVTPKSNNTHDEYTGDMNPDNDQKYYSNKWMGEYTKADIDFLETYYIGLDRDFKIVTTNHKDYAKKISKASLHMDKCFQEVISGASGADAKYKAARETFDTLSKSAQFSESQRGQNDVGLGGFGVVFDQVEQNKWVPKHIPLDEDAMDKIINQFATIRESV